MTSDPLGCFSASENSGASATGSSVRSAVPVWTEVRSGARSGLVTCARSRRGRGCSIVRLTKGSPPKDRSVSKLPLPYLKLVEQDPEGRAVLVVGDTWRKEVDRS